MLMENTIRAITMTEKVQEEKSQAIGLGYLQTMWAEVLLSSTNYLETVLGLAGSIVYIITMLACLADGQTDWM